MQMVFHVTQLRVHKSERNTLDESQDWTESNNACGLFAISDGLGSTIFSEIWARCLVRHFLAEPLQDDNPFEVEYWLHAARSEFEMPSNESDDFLIKRAIRQGSAATFLGTSFDTVSGDQTELVCNSVTIGDSCLLHYREGNLKGSFPLKNEDDFSGITDNFPTLGYGGNWWERVMHSQIRVCAGDTLILATDAVAKWLLVNDAKRRAERFELIARQSADKWPDFVRQIREAGELEDDDSTALVIRIESVDFDNSKAKALARINKEKRQNGLQQAYGKGDWEAMARIAGNCESLLSAKIQDKIQTLEAMPKFQRARRKMKAVREVSAALGRRHVEIQILAKLWEKHRDSLSDEPDLFNQMQQRLQGSALPKSRQAKSPPPVLPPDDLPNSPPNKADHISVAKLRHPKAVQWFSWIAIIWGAMLFALLIALLLPLTDDYFYGKYFGNSTERRGSPTAIEIVLIVACALFAPAYLSCGWIVKRKRGFGIWICTLFLIIALLPFTLLLLINWLNPNLKRWFDTN